MGKQILVIDDIAPDRDIVTIRGVNYELLTYDDFGLADNATLQRLGRRVVAAMSHIAEIKEKEIPAFEADLDAMIGKILKDIPEDVAKGLNYRQKAAVLTAFWKAVVEASKKTSATAEMTTEVTTEVIGEK
jgi:hypothetical protein